MSQFRKTKYSVAITDFMQSVGHATNADILTHLHSTYPNLSATTVHRITSSMVNRNMLASAPVAPGNVARFDANLAGHDHFECIRCGCIRDIAVPSNCLEGLQEVLGECKFGGHLNIQGTCKECLKSEEKLL